AALLRDMHPLAAMGDLHDFAASGDESLQEAFVELGLRIVSKSHERETKSHDVVTQPYGTVGAAYAALCDHGTADQLRPRAAPDEQTSRKHVLRHHLEFFELPAQRRNQPDQAHESVC